MSDDVIEDEGDAPTSHMTGRMTVIGRVSGRRFWTIEQKMAVLRDGFGPGWVAEASDGTPRDYERAALFVATAGDVRAVKRDTAPRITAMFC